MKYVVKFLNLSESTMDEFKYNNLFDAIKVAKETNIAPDRLHIQAIPDNVFNEQFFTLLTSGFIYAGQKTAQFPDGDIMIMLFKRDEDRRETPIYSNVIPMNYVSYTHAVDGETTNLNWKTIPHPASESDLAKKLSRQSALYMQMIDPPKSSE